jgi:hypothetical protein
MEDKKQDLFEARWTDVYNEEHSLGVYATEKEAQDTVTRKVGAWGSNCCGDIYHTLLGEAGPWKWKTRICGKGKAEPSHR